LNLEGADFVNSQNTTPATSPRGRAADRVKLLIGGRFIQSKTTEWGDVLNPATQEVLASVPGPRGPKLGDLGHYGKQVIQFYTQTKTVTSRWFEDSALPGGVNTTISLK